MRKIWVIWAMLALISVSTICLMIIWSGSQPLLDSLLDPDLITSFHAGGAENSTNALSSLSETAAEIGWSTIVRSAPFALNYFFLGIPGFIALLALFTLLTLALVYFIANEYVGSEMALMTVFVFALSPLIYKFPQEIIPVFSSGFVSLFAIYMALKAMRSRVAAKSIVFWLFCALACLLNFYLVPWGTWLPVFITLVALTPRLTSSQTRNFLIAVFAVWLLIGIQQITHYDPVSNATSNPLQELMLMPNAVQTGYSEIIPRDFGFSLPGNNPAMIIALVSIVLIAQEKSRLWSVVAIWFVVGLGFNFWYIQSGVDEGFVIFMFPMALLIANFFGPVYSPFKLIGAAIVALLVFSVFGAMEPTISEVVVSHQFPGWKTAVPFRDIGQIMGGLLPISVVLYLFLPGKVSTKGQLIYLSSVFLIFCFSQLGLLILL